MLTAVPVLASVLNCLNRTTTVPASQGDGSWIWIDFHVLLGKPSMAGMPVNKPASDSYSTRTPACEVFEIKHKVVALCPKHLVVSVASPWSTRHPKCNVPSAVASLIWCQS